MGQVCAAHVVILLDFIIRCPMLAARLAKCTITEKASALDQVLRPRNLFEEGGEQKGSVS